MQDWVRRRILRREPLQYLLGDQPFAGLNLRVRPPTLIPRPETEEWALRCAAEIMRGANDSVAKSPAIKAADTYTDNVNIVDLCTGSGCIALALAQYVWRARVLGIDVAPRAVALARVNAHRCGLDARARFAQADLLAGKDDLAGAWATARRISGLFTAAFESGGTVSSVDYVVANPPYVSAMEYRDLDADVKNWEDPAALLGPGDDGAGFYPVLARIARELLRRKCQQTRAPGASTTTPKVGNRRVLFMEIGGQEQAVAVSNAILDAGFASTETWRDFAGKTRVVIGLL
ncbi:hypothetical protein HDU83_001467 [Entophlyctis luteolus]|nr:hypothetical protein HDU83_001467 [Entophlyctis luteolus]